MPTGVSAVELSLPFRVDKFDELAQRRLLDALRLKCRKARERDIAIMRARRTCVDPDSSVDIRAQHARRDEFTTRVWIALLLVVVQEVRERMFESVGVDSTRVWSFLFRRRFHTRTP